MSTCVCGYMLIRMCSHVYPYEDIAIMAVVSLTAAAANCQWRKFLFDDQSLVAAVLVGSARVEKVRTRQESGHSQESFLQRMNCL